MFPTTMGMTVTLVVRSPSQVVALGSALPVVHGAHDDDAVRIAQNMLYSTPALEAFVTLVCASLVANVAFSSWYGGARPLPTASALRQPTAGKIGRTSTVCSTHDEHPNVASSNARSH